MQRAAYVLYLTASFAPKALMFLLLLVLTRLLPMAEYGVFVLVITTAELWDMALCNWVRVFALRSEGAGSALRPRRFGRIVALTGLTAGLSILLGVLSGLLRQDNGSAFALAVGALMVAFTPLRMALILLQIRRMHGRYAAVEGLRAGGTFLAASGAALLIGPTSLTAALGVAAATLAAGLVGLAMAMRGLARPQRARTGYGAALAFGLPIMVAQILVYTLGLFDRFVVDLLMGPHAVAVLAATYSLIRQPTDLFVGPMNSYAFPHLVKIFEREGAEASGRAQAALLTTFVGLGGAIAAGLVLLAEPLLTLALPPDYRAEGLELVPWIAVGSLFLLAKFFIFDNIFHLSKTTRLQPLSMLPSAVIGLGLCVVLVPRLGLVGAGVSYAAGGAVACLVTAFVTMRILPVPMPWGALGRIALANAAASSTLVAVRDLLAGAGPFAVLAGATLAYVAVYAGALSLMGLSIRRAVETPWEPAWRTPDRKPALAPALGNR